MNKVYVTILLSVVFCSMDAMEADRYLQKIPINSGRPCPEQKELHKKRIAFEKAVTQNRNIRRTGADIIIYLRNWFSMIPDQEMCDEDTLETIGKDLLEAGTTLQKKKYEEFKSRTMNAENLILGLVRQQERRERKERRAKEQGTDALQYSTLEGSVY
jgi:hypothetical protein